MTLFMCVCYVDCDLHEGSDGDLLIVWPQGPAQCGPQVNTPRQFESKSIHKELLRVFRDKEGPQGDQEKLRREMLSHVGRK